MVDGEGYLIVSQGSEPRDGPKQGSYLYCL